MLFELAKHNGIECYSPINLNNFSIRKYSEYDHFSVHDRTPDLSKLDELDDIRVTEYLSKYFSKRFSANLEQHDVLNAFSKNKNIYSRDEIVSQYELKENLPIVIVMSHIFCDAPHAYPGTLYSDYKEWFLNTVVNLKNNDKVNFLIKGHPSAELYGEYGYINSLLNEIGCEHLLLKDDVHSLTVLNEFDVVVTCGGTIGQEFAYKGKPVVLGAKPPYSGFGFTVEPGSKTQYETLMRSGIEDLPVLNDNQKKMVNKVLYHDFVLLDNYSNDLEIGGQRFYMGRDINYNDFCHEVLSYNQILLEDQNVYSLLKRFVESDDIHLLRDESE